MNILLLAPHPFYQDRGTPIAVHLLLRAMAGSGHHFDLLTYHEGRDIAYPHVTLIRIPRIPGVSNIPPGFSLRKLLCDLLLLVKALRLARRRRYDLVHAVEESAFIAMLIRFCFGIPYVFDMDSSMSGQIVEKMPWLKLLAPGMRFFEGRAIRRALAVVPVCDALAETAARHKAQKIFLLRDVSLLSSAAGAGAENLKQKLGFNGPCLMYIGNLEAYQGLDLLLKSFALAVRGGAAADLVIVGGTPQQIEHYRDQARRMGIGDCAHFPGPRPIAMLSALFANADILVSPRIKGRNTPMKIYSYLESGKPILATDLPTHTQVLSPAVAVLEAPTPARFAAGMRRLLDDAALGRELAARAKTMAAEKYSYPIFERAARELYRWLEQQPAARPRAL